MILTQSFSIQLSGFHITSLLVLIDSTLSLGCLEMLGNVEMGNETGWWKCGTGCTQSTESSAAVCQQLWHLYVFRGAFISFQFKGDENGGQWRRCMSFQFTSIKQSWIHFHSVWTCDTWLKQDRLISNTDVGKPLMPLVSENHFFSCLIKVHLPQYSHCLSCIDLVCSDLVCSVWRTQSGRVTWRSMMPFDGWNLK